MRERILDIGIGKGGDYIHQNRAHRVGLDNSHTSLELFPKSINTDLCQADAESILPFEQLSFDRVDIILPHDELLYALIQTEAPLWHELYRVTKYDTTITIVVDVPMMGQQGIYVHNEPMIISMPQIKIVNSATNSGFQLFILKNMTPADVSCLGTEFSKWLARDMQAIGTNVYKFVLTK